MPNAASSAALATALTVPQCAKSSYTRGAKAQVADTRYRYGNNDAQTAALAALTATYPWPREVVERVLPLWPERIAAGPGEGVAPDAFGVDRADSGEISICAGWALDDAKAHVEEVFSTRSLEAAAAFLDEAGRARDPILIDEHSPARALTEAGVEEQLLTHAGQESLARPIAAAMKRKIKTSAGGWVWAPRGDQPIHVLGAASLAVLGASQTTTSSTSSSGREVVAL